MTRRKFQTSAEETLERGLYFTRELAPPAWPSKTGSTCKSTCSQDNAGQYMLLNLGGAMVIAPVIRALPGQRALLTACQGSGPSSAR